jgi:Zn-dependent protease
MLRFLRVPHTSPSLSKNERELLAATVGIGRYRVVTRWPFTVAFGPRAWLPGAAGAFMAFVVLDRQGVIPALVGAAIAGVALLLSIAAHEVGHLVASQGVLGVSPRMLLMRSSGGVSIVEGRFKEPRGAARFAAGGPIATLLFTAGLIATGLLVPAGPLSVGLLVPGLINVAMLVVNLLPIAPTDGYSLFRSAVWAEIGNRAEADRRAIGWSRVVIAVGLSISILVFATNELYGMLAIVMLASFTAQHHLVVRRSVGS